MAFTLWLGHMTRLRMESLQGFLPVVAFWLTLEFLCLRINFISPWVVLGNGLSKDISFIQWYEVTGVAGGTLWIFLSNLFLSRLLTTETKNKRKIFADILLWSAIVILPAATSVIRFNTIRPSKVNRNEAVIIQPDFDPYTQKFSIPFDIQLAASLKMAESGITERTKWIVAPETLIDDPVNEDKLEDNKYVKSIRDFVDNHPGTAFVTGMVSSCKVRSATGSVPENTISYFNSAFKIDTGSVIEIYHKSRLVPGFEFVPAGKLMQKISKVLPEIGFKNRDYGTQPKRSCFVSADRSFKIAPVICYESVYGEYVTDYIKEGAEAIFIITNDGWWKNTNGYKQHLSYASLRAIETRKPVIRSANTGISCFMDIRGKIVQKTKWWTPALLKGDFYPEKRITPYVRFGDYLMRAACILSLLTIIVVFVIQPLRKRLK
jgi:apolipoprotein N-acyltransferase